MNEWLRRHKNIFMGAALLAMAGMTFWGAAHYLWESKGSAAASQEAWYYTLNGERVHVPSEKLLSGRLQLHRFYNQASISLGFFPAYLAYVPSVLGYGGQGYGWIQSSVRGGQIQEISSRDAMRYLAQTRILEELGFFCGRHELEDLVRENVQRRTGQETVTPETYQRLMTNVQLSRNQFERLVLEGGLRGKYGEALRQSKVPDAALYVRHCMEDQQVRLLYKRILSRDYEAQVTAPTAEQITAYYNDNSKQPAGSPDALQTQPTLSADVLFLADKEVEPQIVPSQDDLKKFYTEKRAQFWKKQNAAAGEDAYKPYESVKDDVLAKYRHENIFPKAAEALDKVRTDLEKDEAALPPDKKLDLKAFATAHKLHYWTTQALAADGFKKGQTALDAPDFKLAETLFPLVAKNPTPETEQIRAKERKRFQAAHPLPELAGTAVLRLAGMVQERPMTKVEATPVITQRLREKDSITKAEAAAKELQTKWSQGESLPKIEQLTDEWVTNKSENPLARACYRNTLAAGEVLPVQSDKDPDPALPPDSPRRSFLVGFAGEYKLPSFDAFMRAIPEDLKDERGALAMLRQEFRSRRALENLMTKDNEIVPANQPDPPLYAVRQRGEVPDDI